MILPALLPRARMRFVIFKYKNEKLIIVFEKEQYR